MSKTRKRPKKRLHNKLVINVKHHSYQPSVAEQRETVRLNVTPEKLRAATVRDVELREID